MKIRVKKAAAALLAAAVTFGAFPAGAAAGQESGEEQNKELQSLVQEIVDDSDEKAYNASGIYSDSWYEVLNDQTNARSRAWREGMVSGNGENGVISSGAPYHDTMIYQYMYFNFPSADPIEAPEDEYTYLEEARQAVYNLDDSWNVHGRNRTYYYAYHPGAQMSLQMSSQGTVSDYKRWTNYETAEVGVQFTDEKGKWERRTFTSREDNVTVTSIQSSSRGEPVNMTISVDDISNMSKGYNGMSKVSDLRYKKIVSDDCSYIAEVAKYPSYANSDLKYGGYATVTYLIVEGGSKEKALLPESDTTMNVGEENNPAIRITDADAVYLITKSNRDADMCSYRNFAGKKSYDLVDRLVQETKAVAEKQEYKNRDGSFSYSKILEPHAKLHGDAFRAAKFTLDGDEEDKELPTEELLQKQGEDKSYLNHALLERAWYAGRYAQLCASGICAYRLCGMWTGEFNGGWRYIFTMDANVNLQGSAMNTNHMPYGPQGYITYFLRLADDFRVNAERAYGMHDALQVSVNSDGDHAQAVEYDRWYPFQYWNAGTSWCLLPIYEYWQCYGNQQISVSDLVDYDKLRSVLSMKDEDGDGYYEELTKEEMDAKLARGYLDLEEDILLPLLTKQSNFWEQIVTPEYYMDKDGKACYTQGKTALEEGERYMLIPTYSPENNPIGYSSTITANATMDISAARDGLNMTIALERAVKRDGYEQAVAKWENLRELLPEYKYDNTASGEGALREWAMDEYTENNNHRHVSHLYVAWPAYETKEDEKLRAGAIQSLINRDRYNTGDATTGHGWVHRALTYARIEDGDGVLASLKPLITNHIFYSSMMTDHNSDRGSDTYCTDTSMGLVGTINEMVLFSNTGKIQLCPALGSDWTSGSMDGLMARTQAEVEKLSWNTQKGRVSAQIRSDIDQTIELTSQLPWIQAEVSGAAAEITEGEKILLTMKAGDTANIEFYRDAADKASLSEAISAAHKKLDSHKEEDSNYVKGAQEAFAQAITTAQAVWDNTSAEITEIRTALTALDAAQVMFDAAYDNSISFKLPEGIYTSERYFAAVYSESPWLEIRYTTDGTEPASDSPVLTGRRRLPAGKSSYRAALFVKDSGAKISETISAEYLYLNGTNLAYKQNISSSLPYWNDLDVSKAVDGNSATRWAVKGDSSVYEAELTLEEETELNSIYIDEYTEIVDNETNRIESFELYAEKDGQYERIYSFDGSNVGESEQVIYDTTRSSHAKYAAVFEPVKTAKVKLVCKAIKEVSIWELQMFHLKEPVPTESLEETIAKAAAFQQEHYTPESWNLLLCAVNAAKQAVENGTIESSEQAAALQTAIETAMDQLVEKKEDNEKPPVGPDETTKPDNPAKPGDPTKPDVPSLKQVSIQGKSSYQKAYGAKAFALNLTCEGTANGTLAYTSSQPKVASVSTAGTVSIKSTGRTIITVKLVSETYQAEPFQVTVEVAPSKVSLSSVKSKKAKQMTITWKKLASKQNISGYQIEYSRKKNMKSPVRTGVKKTAKTVIIKKLKAKTSYYVRIRAYKKAGKDIIYGNWSSKKTVKVK